MLTAAADDLLSFIFCDFFFKGILPVGGICIGAFLFISDIILRSRLNIFRFSHNRPVLTLRNDCSTVIFSRHDVASINALGHAIDF